MLVLIWAAPWVTAAACEPPAFDFPKFLVDHDHNKDGYLQSQELVGVRYNQDGYQGRLDKPLNTGEAFSELDADGDQRLSQEELWAWGRYTHNACANRDWPSATAKPGLFERLNSMLDAFRAQRQGWSGQANDQAG